MNLLFFNFLNTIDICTSRLFSEVELKEWEGLNQKWQAPFRLVDPGTAKTTLFLATPACFYHRTEPVH
jgi:hypothetical protein